MKTNTHFQSYFKKPNRLLKAICLVVLIFAQSNQAFSAPFTKGNLVVTRVGNGSTALTAAKATDVFLDEYTTTGVLVQTVNMPTTTSAPNYRFGYIDNSNYDGLISLSVDKRYLVLAGVNTAAGSTVVANTPSVIARVDNNANINTSTLIPHTAGAVNYRSVISTDGTVFWQAGNNTGMNYTSLGTITAATLISPLVSDNFRGMGIIDNKLYFCSPTSGKRFSIMGDITGAALPTTAANPTTLIADASPITAPGSFVMFDLDPLITGVDVAYVTEDVGSAIKGLSKYALISGTWTYKGNIAVTAGLKGITGSVTAGGVVLYAATQNETNTKIVTITDNTGQTGTLTGSFTTIATAATNKAFKGVCFAPETISNAPTSVVATAGDGSAAVAFVVPTYTGGSAIIDYTVTSNSGGFTTTGTSSPLTVTGLTNGLNYTFTVTARNSTGSSLASAPSNSITPIGGIVSISTSDATVIGSTSATFNGDITSAGGQTITDRGFNYKTTAGVTNENPVSIGGTTIGAFSSAISGLTPNTQYFYKAYATNGTETKQGGEINFYTLAAIPSAPTVNNARPNTVDISINANGNPAATEFAIQEVGSSKYLQADGRLSATAVWQTAATWGTKTVINLLANTSYTFQVKARNAASTETAFSTTTSLSTTANVAFTKGNLVVSRVGDGVAVLAGVFTSTYLDEYTSSGTFIQSVALPTTTSGGNNAFGLNGTATAEGTLKLSTDKRYLVMGGYQSGVASAGTPRVIARVDKDAVINSTTALTDVGSTPFRSVISSNGTDFWVAFSGGTGLNYAALGSATSTALSAAAGNVRGLGIYDNQLYFCSATPGIRFCKVGTSLPTTAGQTTTMIIPNYNATTEPNGLTAPNNFIMFDLDATVPGVDVMYVAEDISGGTTTTIRGLQKYSLVGGAWIKTGYIAHADGLRDLTGEVTVGGVVIYAVTQSTNTPEVMTKTDNTGYNGTMTGTLTTLISSGTNTVIRGIAFAPQAPEVADAPTSVLATAGNAKASVAFTTPNNNGSAITNYTVTPYIGTTAGTPVTGTSSPIVVTGLANSTAYTFKVFATNGIGDGTVSAASNEVTPDAVANIITVSSSANATELSLTPVSDVVVNTGVLMTISAPIKISSLTIAGGGNVSNTSTFTTNDFNISSDATNGSGTYNDNGGTTIITGAANVSQYLKGLGGADKRAYWYVASPVSAATANTFNVEGTVNKMTYYNEATTSYATQLSYNTTSLTKGVGYVAYIGGTDAPYTFTTNTGDNSTKLNSGNVPVSVTRTGTSAGKRGFNLIGNPYPSYLDWNQVDKTNVLPTIWYRSVTGNMLNDVAEMTFDTYNSALNEVIKSSNNTNVLSQHIPPMQAFWVKVRSEMADVAGLTVNFNNAMRSHQTVALSGLLRAPKADVQKVLRLQVSNGVSSDQTIIAANVNASNSLDDYDSPKMSNDNVNLPEIYTSVGNEKVAMNGLNSLTIGDNLPLGFSTGVANSFTIQATEIRNFDTDTRIILKDNLGTEKDITDGAVYSFASDAVSNDNRFSILFKSASVTTGVESSSNNPENIYIARNINNQIVVNSNEDLDGIISVFNSMGQMQITIPINGKCTTINHIFKSGVYFVTVNTVNSKITKKVVVN